MLLHGHISPAFVTITASERRRRYEYGHKAFRYSDRGFSAFLAYSPPATELRSAKRAIRDNYSYLQGIDIRPDKEDKRDQGFIDDITLLLANSYRAFAYSRS